MNSKLTSQRLMKQQKGLMNQPIPNALVTRDGHLNFHFCLYDLEGPYKDGLYHGLLELHQNYPFNAPKLFFYTPSGRFQIDIPICTSFTNYHQQTWTSAWNVRSLILATISFMYSQQPSYGCRADSQQQRIRMAKNSKNFNLKNQNFVNFFSQQLLKLNKITPQDLQRRFINNEQHKDDNLNIQFNNQQHIQHIQVNEQLIVNQIAQNPHINLIIRQRILEDIHGQYQNRQKNKRFWIKISCYGVVFIAGFLVYKYIS